MAATKRTTKAADTKTEEVKTAKAESVAAPEKEETKAEDKKTTRKTTAKKTPAKKATEEKKTRTRKTAVKEEAAVQKEEVKATVQLQYAGRSISMEELVQNAKNVWEYDLNQKPEDFKTVELYVKPEESAVYYVVNGDVTGSFGL